ncbi:MAG: YceD family protein [Ketobacteraceae bacterium]|nr:YceD family protein [Ketobacteraceae bacterium]
MTGLNPYYCALMLESTLPEQVKPVKFAKRGASFNGRWSLERFKRLAADTVSGSGEVIVQAEFGFEEGFPAFKGTASVNVQLVCQRCLEPVVVPLDVSFGLVFVSSEEQAGEVPEPLETVLLQDEEISILEVVEDELLLALPIVAFHRECEAFDYRTDDEKADEQSRQEPSENPFSVLEQLKGKLKSDD